MSSYKNDLKDAYIEKKRAILKNKLYRLNHFEIPKKLNPHNPIKELLVYHYCYKWLRENVQSRYYSDVLTIARNKTYDFLVDLLINAPDERRFLKNYIIHCSKPENIRKAPHNYKAKAIYERFGQDMERTVDNILSLCRTLGYDENRAKMMAREASKEKEIYEGVYGILDKVRLQLLDKLNSSSKKNSKVEFHKLAVVPTLKCKYRCRHCMFLWRPSFKSLIPREYLFKIINPFTQNLLFTGGDLTGYLSDFYDAVENMDHIKTFAILLNGAFGETKAESDAIAADIDSALKRRKNKQFKDAFVILQISFDEFHQEILLNKEGIFFEKLPVKNIANIIESSLPYENIGIVLLHKQNSYNFSDHLFRKGVIARLIKEFEKRNNPMTILRVEKSNRKKINPVSGQPSFRMISDIYFSLKNNAKKLFSINSSLVERLGKAKWLDTTEFVSAEDVRDAVCCNGVNSEILDTDLMFWYNGNITCFSIPHLTFGNLLDDDIQRIINRYQIDPLLEYMKNFDQRLLDYYKEIKGDFQEIYEASSSHVNLFHHITTSDTIRLYLTKRILLEHNKTQKLKDDDFHPLHIPDTVDELKEEYLKWCAMK